MGKNNKISVTSEIGRLRRLLVHSPDSGLGKVVPSKAQDWLFEDYDPEEPQTLVENVIEWCKRTLAECRRPYGINSFDLTIAIRAGHESGAFFLDAGEGVPYSIFVILGVLPWNFLSSGVISSARSSRSAYEICSSMS